MFNLIRRDLILQKRQLILFIPFTALFILMDSHPALTFLVVSIFIPFNAYAYDEKAEANILLNSLPYTRAEIIASRYIGAIVYMLLAIGITSFALYVFNKPFELKDIALGGGLFLLFASLTFPLFYILKPGYITTVVLISFILLTGSVPYFAREFAARFTAITQFIASLSIPTLYMGAAIAILVVYAISWGITHLIYQRKAF